LIFAAKRSLPVMTTPRRLDMEHPSGGQNNFGGENTMAITLQGGTEKSLSDLYAVVVTDNAHALVYADGHFRVRWNETDNVDVRYPIAKWSGEKAVQEIVDGFLQFGLVPKVHIVPKFTSLDAVDLWYMSIGLRTVKRGR
jgi:hypothetical protein